MPLQHGAGDVGQILPRGHDVEVEIGREPEELEHLVEHLAVLGGDADRASKRGSAASACASGAILIASGRVPKTHKILSVMPSSPRSGTSS